MIDGVDRRLKRSLVLLHHRLSRLAHTDAFFTMVQQPYELRRQFLGRAHPASAVCLHQEIGDLHTMVGKRAEEDRFGPKGRLQ